MHVVRALQEVDLPDGVEVVDAGTAALDALCLLGKVDKLIVVDAVAGGGPAGTVYRFAPEDVTEESGLSVSLHDLGLLPSLEMAAQIGVGAGFTVILGVEPERMDWSLDLSPTVASRVQQVVDRVLEEIA